MLTVWLSKTTSLMVNFHSPKWSGEIDPSTLVIFNPQLPSGTPCFQSDFFLYYFKLLLTYHHLNAPVRWTGFINLLIISERTDQSSMLIMTPDRGGLTLVGITVAGAAKKQISLLNDPVNKYTSCWSALLQSDLLKNCTV